MSHLIDTGPGFPHEVPRSVRARYKEVADQPFIRPPETPKERPLEVAERLVHGERHGTYGHPADDFGRTAGMWRAAFGWDVEAKDVALAMILAKVSRLRQSPEHEDSVVDIAGYAETYQMVIDLTDKAKVTEGNDR